MSSSTKNQYNEREAKRLVTALEHTVTVLEHEKYILMSICVGNYNKADEFRELVRQEVDSDEIADMVSGGKDCGIIEDYLK
eukprot:2060643-Prymnesium_polylepis.1